jgi:hypothetical protein
MDFDDKAFQEEIRQQMEEALRIAKGQPKQQKYDKKLMEPQVWFWIT